MRSILFRMIALLVITLLVTSGSLDAFSQRSRGGGFGGGRGGFSAPRSGGSGGGISGGGRGGYSAPSTGTYGGGGYSGGYSGGYRGPSFFFVPFFFGGGGGSGFGSVCCIMFVILIAFIAISSANRRRATNMMYDYDAYAPPGGAYRFEPWGVAAASFRLPNPELYVSVVRQIVDDTDFSDVRARSRALQELAKAIDFSSAKDTVGGVSSGEVDADEAGLNAERLNAAIVEALNMQASLINTTTPEGQGVQLEEAPSEFGHVMMDSECIITLVTAHRLPELEKLRRAPDRARALWDYWRDNKADDTAAIYIGFTPDPGQTMDSRESARIFGSISSVIRQSLG